jgi:hypothetical protein
MTIPVAKPVFRITIFFFLQDTGTNFDTGCLSYRSRDVRTREMLGSSDGRKWKHAR